MVPSFRCTFLPDMPPSTTPGSPDIVSSTSRCRHGFRRGLTGSTLPKPPQSVSHAGAHFRGFTGLQLLRPQYRLARLPSTDPTGTRPRPPEAFTSRLPTGRSPFPSLDMTTTSIGLLCRRTLAEIRFRGISRLERKGATKRAADLSHWLKVRFLELYQSRTIPLAAGAALETGRMLDRAMAAGGAPGFKDAAIAAIAFVNDLTVVTANERHFKHFGVTLISPRPVQGSAALRGRSSGA